MNGYESCPLSKRRKAGNLKAILSGKCRVNLLIDAICDSIGRHELTVLTKAEVIENMSMQQHRVVFKCYTRERNWLYFTCFPKKSLVTGQMSVSTSTICTAGSSGLKKHIALQEIF